MVKLVIFSIVLSLLIGSCFLPNFTPRERTVPNHDQYDCNTLPDNSSQFKTGDVRAMPQPYEEPLPPVGPAG